MSHWISCVLQRPLLSYIEGFTNMNNITMTGRLTKAIRSNTVQGTPVVNFTVAVELGTKPQLVTVNGKEILAQVPATSYIDAAAWGPDPQRRDGAHQPRHRRCQGQSPRARGCLSPSSPARYALA